MKVYIGIDNGVSGTVGIIDKDNEKSFYYKTPTKTQNSYTKKKSNVTRIDHEKFVEKLIECMDKYESPVIAFVLMERPMVNPGRFKPTISALMAYESVLIALEGLRLPYEIIDSRKWQKEFLPLDAKGPELKKASLDVGKRLFPQHVETIEKHKDADGLLIAEYARRKRL